MTADELTQAIDRRIADLEDRRGALERDRDKALLGYDNQIKALKKAKTDMSKRAAELLVALKDGGVL